jgi:hypothetical protein
MRIVLAVFALLALTASASVPVISQCSGSYVFALDTGKTHTEPSDVEKGTHVAIVIEGTMTQNVKISELDVTVYLNGIKLDTINTPDTKTVTAGSDYT